MMIFKQTPSSRKSSSRSSSNSRSSSRTSSRTISTHSNCLGTASTQNTSIVLCENLRPVIYKPSIGVHWPFAYNHNENKLSICQKLDTAPEDIPIIFLSLGKVTEERNVPEVIYRLNKETSQGKVFVVNQDVNGAKVNIVVKADSIKNQNKNLWFTQSPKIHIKGELGTHVIIADSYMDALCSILLSNLVESDVSPHFPVCYGTNVSYTKLKRNTRKQQGKLECMFTPKGGSLSQVIWMEYLPTSLYNYLKEEKSAEKWWSCIFQVVAALLTAHKHYRFIHNDMHCANIRMRRVPKETVLYYRMSNDTTYAVPTFGYVCVLIDFGRACVAPHKGSDLLVSSEFVSGGACYGYVPDTRNIDLVRFILSIEDQTPVISNDADRRELMQFFRNVCKTENDVDLFKEVAKKLNLGYFLDKLPRKVCKSALPEHVIESCGPRFACTEIPKDVQVFEI